MVIASLQQTSDTTFPRTTLHRNLIHSKTKDSLTTYPFTLTSNGSSGKTSLADENESSRRSVLSFAGHVFSVNRRINAAEADVWFVLDV